MSGFIIRVSIGTMKFGLRLMIKIYRLLVASLITIDLSLSAVYAKSNKAHALSVTLTAARKLSM